MRLVLTLLLGLTGWAGLAEFERGAVYPFDSTEENPQAMGLNGVKAQKLALNGETLVIWTATAQPGKPTILYFHGNAGNLANRADRFEQFISRGYGLVAPAYRGSSGSTGLPSEQVITSDMVALHQNLDRLVPGLTTDDLVIYGESLGTGVALKLVAARPKHQPRAVVLEAPFTSLPDVARHTSPGLIPLLPLMKNRWKSRKHVRSLTAPLLIIHGTADTLIPFKMGQKIYANAGSKTKLLLPVPGAEHNYTWRSDVMPTLWRFIEESYKREQ